MRPEMSLLYVRSESIGYGRMGVKVAAALERAGVDIYDSQFSPEIREDTSAEGRRAKLTNVIAWLSVPTHAPGWYDGQTAVIWTMWEASILPPSFRENLHAFETVVVPSQHNVELFSRYHDNVRFVPLGVDPDEWHYVPRQEPSAFFDFLIGGSGPRKGTDLAFRAFNMAFPDGSWGDGPIPRLTFKSPRGMQYYEDPKWGKQACDGDRIRYIHGRIPTEDEIAVYANAHCYLQPSRGEGFGLQPLQAMAQGMPTILTGAHGHASFSHLGLELGYEMKQSDYFIYGNAGDWWEPNLDDLIDHMREVYENYDAACDRAKTGASVINAEFTWDKVADRFMEVVGRDKFTTPYHGEHIWTAPESKRYLVVTNKDWVANVAGATYYFRKGKRYWEIADVKRVMFEAGLLDPECLKAYSLGEEAGADDIGLTLEQCERLGEYTASRGSCPTCGHDLNDGETEADRIYAQMTAEAEAAALA